MDRPFWWYQPDEHKLQVKYIATNEDFKGNEKGDEERIACHSKKFADEEVNRLKWLTANRFINRFHPKDMDFEKVMGSINDDIYVMHCDGCEEFDDITAWESLQLERDNQKPYEEDEA